MNPELKVGILAMVVGCTKPENSHQIGKVVTLEYQIPIGFPEVPQEFLIVDIRLVGIMETLTWVVSGTDSSSKFYKKGFACFDSKHLMPLPPLDDDAIIHSTETPKETETC